MQPIYLDSEEGMRWLRETHCPKMPARMTCAVLYGNQDSPTKVEAWEVTNPHYQAPPDYVWKETD